MQRSLSGSIALTKFKHYIIKINGKKGPVKGIFIPVDENDQNYLVKGKEDTYYANIRVVVNDTPDKYNQHGFIAHSVDSQKYREASEQQKELFKKLPILGNIRDFEAPQNDGNLGSINYNEIPATANGEDLPF